MVVGQLVIAAPIVTGLTLAAVQQVPAAFRLQLLGLGASRPQMIWVLLKEARLPMLAAVMAGFGGVISEVGASMMLGGNIKGSTRVLTTATVLETGKGNFDVAIALSVILLLITFLVNWALSVIQQRRRGRNSCKVARGTPGVPGAGCGAGTGAVTCSKHSPHFI